MIYKSNDQNFMGSTGNALDFCGISFDFLSIIIDFSKLIIIILLTFFFFFVWIKYILDNSHTKNRKKKMQ